MPTKQYTQEEMWKVFETLPEKLKQAVFSAENAEHTFSICERYGIEECSQVASLVGLVLMGVALPRDFGKALTADLQLDEQTSQQVAQEINRFVFYPVKAELEHIHRQPGDTDSLQQIGSPTPRHSDRTNDYVVQADEEDSSPQDFEENEEGAEAEPTPKKQDSYRESIE